MRKLRLKKHIAGILGLICMVAASNADTYVADRLYVDPAGTIAGTTDQDVSVDGYGYAFNRETENDATIIYFNTSNNVRIVRSRFDFRLNLERINLSIGAGWAYYTPAETNADTNNLCVSNESDGWSTNLLAAPNTTAIADLTTSGGVPANGFTPEDINWIMIRPESTGTAAPLQPDNQSYYLPNGAETNSLVSQRAVALGLIWSDINTNSLLDSGDFVTLRWAVTADTFAEMDTVAELNALAVANNQPKPVGLTAETGGPDSIVLDWVNVADSAWESYNVYRSQESGTNYVQIASNLTDSAHTDTGLATGEFYYYVVTSVDTNASESAYSDEASAVTSGGPQTLAATAQDEAVALDWDDSTNPKFYYYSVYRSEESGTNYVLIASNLTESAYTDSGLVNETTYYYVLTETTFTTGESGYGNEVSATPLAAVFNVYDLSLLDNNDGSQFSTTLTFPATTDQLLVNDPSDDSGRMDRSYFRFNALNNTKMQLFTGVIYSKSGYGFSGTDVLNQDVSSGAVFWANGSGTVYYLPDGVIVWFARTPADEWANQTPFNDMAYGIKLTDNGNPGVDAGDTIEIVGIIYTQGTGSVFGKTADELTAMLTAAPTETPFEIWTADFGLSGDDAAAGFDFDGDGLVNLGEYAFGGNPTNSASIGEQPVMTLSDSGMQYVYRIVADTNVAHQVVTSTNLVTGGGSIGVTPLSTNEVNGFNIYSNTVDTSVEAKGFIHVEVSYQ